jgi:hypothetical protein
MEKTAQPSAGALVGTPQSLFKERKVRPMTSQAADAVAERLSGRRPPRLRALLAAGVAAVAAGAFVYKLLRSADPGDVDGDHHT